MGAAVITLTLLACGGSGGASTFDPDGGASSGSTGGSTSGVLGTSGGTSGESTSGSLGDGAACAAETAVAERRPAHIFFIYDTSGSMGRSPYGDPAQKWTPVTTAFKGFLQSATSEGVKASLTTFPAKGSNNCKLAGYSTLDVALTDLPNASSSAFNGALGGANDLGDENDGTPTLWAVRGVLPLAKANAEANPDAKTVVVLVTDGEPQQCDGSGDNANNADNVVKEIEKFKDVVPTYVIGVGTNTTNLNRFAEAGNTKAAILINVGNPEETQTQFTNTVNDIRLSSISCELNIPAPPSGQTLDFDKINVGYTPADGSKQALTYDSSCASSGWKFDNEAAPSKIVLCASTCTALKNDPKGTVGVEFGCARRGGVN